MKLSPRLWRLPPIDEDQFEVDQRFESRKWLCSQLFIYRNLLNLFVKATKLHDKAMNSTTKGLVYLKENQACEQAQVEKMLLQIQSRHLQQTSRAVNKQDIYTNKWKFSPVGILALNLMEIADASVYPSASPPNRAALILAELEVALGFVKKEQAREWDFEGMEAALKNYLSDFEVS